VALGYIRAGLVFGGAITIDRERALEAIARVAWPLGLEVLEAARGILEIADASMLRAIHLVSVQKGHDLRSFALVAFGGAGPLHAGRLAQRLGIPRVIVPALSSVYSAFGCLVSDLRYDTVQTYRARLSRLDVDEVARRFEHLEREAMAPLLAEGLAPDQIILRRAMDLRYAGQNYELEAPLEPGRDGLHPRAITATFNDLHRVRYTYATDEDVECVNLRVVAAVPAPPTHLEHPEQRGEARPIAEQEAHFPELGAARVPVYRRQDLGAEPIVGPAIVEDEHSTIVAFPAQRAHADPFGNLHLVTAP
jgi:N-methylhydantoinase A